MQDPQHYRIRLNEKITLPKGIAAIYALVNLINGRMYIGRTRCAQKRVKEHLSQLKNGTHHVIELQLDFKKYRKDAPEWFEFRILEVVNDRKKLPEAEDKWILQHKKAQLYNAPSEYDRAGRRRRKRQRASEYIQGNIFEFMVEE
ncbi:GIY-YIG nuclease family protein [Staphylospora marina]|uniref:GIY-YIG nuclease family protein n=1 Tax=Staphylospora marina TaxID=2490858 RepID=UPI0013DDE34F|nr:GIY-YIG nuclease family protein [Staphylospora marina]